MCLVFRLLAPLEVINCPSPRNINVDLEMTKNKTKRMYLLASLARLAANSLDIFHDVHALNNLPEDHVLAIAPVEVNSQSFDTNSTSYHSNKTKEICCAKPQHTTQSWWYKGRTGCRWCWGQRWPSTGSQKVIKGSTQFD